MKIFLPIFFLFFTLTLQAQAEKGDWLIRGSGYTLNETTQNRSTSDMQFGIGIGYFFSSHWAVGGGLNLRLANRATYVGNEIFARYYLKDTLQRSRIFLEARIEKQDFSPFEIGTASSRFRVVSGIVGVGSNYFLSRKLAIEARLDYYFANWIKRAGMESGGQQIDDYLTIQFALQYFFRYRDFRKEQLVDYRNALKKGKWSVGGSGRINEHENYGIVRIQKFQPRVGYFILTNLEIGFGLNYDATKKYFQRTVGLVPYSRYYLNLGRKRKFFVEGFAGYDNYRIKAGNQKRYTHKLEYGGAIGISNFITKSVSFDLGYRIRRIKTFYEFFKEPYQLSKSGGLTLGLNYYFYGQDKKPK